MTKIDPYKHKQRYENWREEVNKKGILEIGKYNSDLTLRYLDDMSCGYNVSRLSAKGSRSFIRLNTLRQKLVFFSKKFKTLYRIDKITDINELQLCQFFSNMRKGIIPREDGEIYKSVGYYAKNFKAFWHWYMKIVVMIGAFSLANLGTLFLILFVIIKAANAVAKPIGTITKVTGALS